MQQKTMISSKAVLLAGLALAMLITGCSPKTMTVSEVWEDAERLNEKQIRVRGWAYVRTQPYVGLIGCPPAGTIENDVVTGRMFLLPENDVYKQSSEIVISESDLSCEGDHCRISCTPFDPGNMDYCGAERNYSTQHLIPYEIVGTLHIRQIDGERSLFLEDIKLSDSHRMIEGVWEPIPTGTIEYGCP